MEKRNDKKKNVSSVNEALKENKGPIIAVTFVLFLLFAIVSSLALIDILFFFLGYLFIALPSFFAYQRLLETIVQGKEISHRLAFLFFFSYFRMPGRGVYRALLSLLKALPAFIGGSVLFSLLYFGIGYGVSSSAKESLDALVNVYQNGSLTEIISLLNEDQFLLIGSSLSVVVSFYFGLLVILIHMGNYSLSSVVRIAIISDSARTSNIAFGRGFEIVKSEYLPLKRKNGWMLPLLFTFGYASGAYLASLISFNAGALTMGGLLLGSFFLCIALPYFCLHVLSFGDKHIFTFAKEGALLAKEHYQSAKELGIISQEEKEEFDKRIEDALKNIEEASKEDSEIDDQE